MTKRKMVNPYIIWEYSDNWLGKSVSFGLKADLRRELAWAINSHLLNVLRRNFT